MAREWIQIEAYGAIGWKVQGSHNKTVVERHMTDSEIDPSRCPLCRQANQCGMADGTGTCWCFDSPVPLKILEQVPSEVSACACLCRTCLSGRRHPMGEVEKVQNFIRKWR